MQKLIMITIIFLCFFCFGFSGKIFIGDLGLYHEVYIELKGNKLIIKDWESGNEYEFKYDGKGRGKYKGYDWEKEHFLELHIEDNGKGAIFDCDTGFYYPVDLGNLRRLKKSRK